MFNFLVSIISGAVAGIMAGITAGTAASLVLLRFNRREIPKDAAAAAPPPQETSGESAAAPAAPPTQDAPTADAAVPAAAARDVITVVLQSLNKTLSPLAEDIGHPHELPDMPEFQAVVAAFRRPDATFALLSQYALGQNWPFACAAFVVLSEHPERQTLCDQVVQRLASTRPYVLMYALRFLTTLDKRPPIGATLLGASQWWQNNPVIPEFYQDYFADSAKLGDAPTFGDLLEKSAELDPSAITGFLQKIQHPFATQLLAELRAWEESRIDRNFLSGIGTLWDAEDRDPLIITPPAWQQLLATAVAAVCQSRPRSLLVTGDPRIGKTTFVKLLGGLLQDEGWTIFSASGNELMADQMYIGQLEGRIRKLIDSLHAKRRIVWYVRDLGQIANSGTHQGQSASILDQILPAVASGNLIIIGETNEAAASRLTQSRPSLRSVMEILSLQPMTVDETLVLAKRVGERITEHTDVRVSEPAVAATIELAQHYLGSGHLPGTVLDLLKRAAGRSMSAGETALTADSVIATLSQISGLPEVVLDTNQGMELARVRDFFVSRVMGQDEAVKAIVDRIAMLKAGLTDPGRPVGVFLFAGPTGTGKTELAKTLAEFLFGSADRMIRLDMSEFQTAETISKIVGQRGETGSDSLIDRIRKQPFSVVLLDEFEKAHSNSWDLFLQIFDDGRLSDANGREADFRHCFIILTSNLGATVHRGTGIGFRPVPGAYADEQVLQTIGQTFRPEFINRLDRIIVFRPLSRDLMRDILHKELARIQERRGLRERSWAVEWEASAIELLLDRGFSPEMGARPLKRAIDQLLLAPLAATLVEHRFPHGDQFLFVRSNGKEIEIEFVDPDFEPELDAGTDAEIDGNSSLPAIVLHPTGSTAERAALVAHWHGICSEMAAESWTAAHERLRLALADPAVWTRDDRFRLFSGLEMMDRVREAARTAEGLFKRYETTGKHPGRASRELAGRLALQLFNLRQGLDDVASDAPIDALLRIDPAMDAGGDASDWCKRLADMYRQWATKRRMRIKEIVPRGSKDLPILQVTGFGAFRALEAEAGLHVLDDPAQEGARRIVARVTVVGGPDQDLPEAGAFGAACELLGKTPANTMIVRRYREGPAPLVRDVAGGWRSGRLENVLAGDFDLIGAVAREQQTT